jgi:hypothetical protein
MAVIVGVRVGVLGYRLYSRPIDRRVLRADPKKATPARPYADVVAFMPASGSVLFGFQFKSIAALGPIIGPIPAAVILAWDALKAIRRQQAKLRAAPAPRVSGNISAWGAGVAHRARGALA